MWNKINIYLTVTIFLITSIIHNYYYPVKSQKTPATVRSATWKEPKTEADEVICHLTEVAVLLKVWSVK